MSFNNILKLPELLLHLFIYTQAMCALANTLCQGELLLFTLLYNMAQPSHPSKRLAK